MLLSDALNMSLLSLPSVNLPSLGKVMRDFNNVRFWGTKQDLPLKRMTYKCLTQKTFLKQADKLTHEVDLFTV